MRVDTREKFLESIRVEGYNQPVPMNTFNSNNNNNWNNNGGFSDNKGVPTDMFNSLDNR